MVEVRNSKVGHTYRADQSVQKGVSPKRTVLPQNTVRWGAVKYAVHCHGHSWSAIVLLFVNVGYTSVLCKESRSAVLRLFCFHLTK